MTSQELHNLILEHKKDSALLLGNGINRYAQSGCSWDILLKALAKAYCPTIDCSCIQQGITNTEFFDFLEISILKNTPTFDEERFAKQLVNLKGLNANLEKISEDIRRFATNPQSSFDVEKMKESAEYFKNIISDDFLSESRSMITIAELGGKLRPAVNSQLSRSICTLMSKWIPSDCHREVASFAKKNELPILTTNYDNLLGNAVNARFYDFHDDNSSEEHPISCCYTTKRKPDVDKFGIWHINGMIKYPKSILIGLTHYMRALENVRSAIHPANKFQSEIFMGNQWGFTKLTNTWINILFKKNLFIFGLGLESEEVFLRWLLIERAKYYSLFPNNLKKGWYIASENVSIGKDFFLNSAGIEIIRVPDYSSIYNAFSI